MVYESCLVAIYIILQTFMAESRSVINQNNESSNHKNHRQLASNDGNCSYMAYP